MRKINIKSQWVHQKIFKIKIIKLSILIKMLNNNINKITKMKLLQISSIKTVPKAKNPSLNSS